MKIEKVIILFLLGTISSFSQTKDTIRGKLYFSHYFHNEFSLILVKEKDSRTSVVLNKNGEFELIPSVDKKNYDLIFTYKDDTIRKFKFEKKWTKRKRPKSISLNEKCNASRKTALIDIKNNDVKLFLFSRNLNENTINNLDKEIAKQYNFKYVYLKRIEQFDCYLDYNRKVLEILPLKIGSEFLKKLNKNVIGMN